MFALALVLAKVAPVWLRVKVGVDTAVSAECSTVGQWPESLPVCNLNGVL